MQLWQMDRPRRCVAFFRHANARTALICCTHLSAAIAVSSLLPQLHLGARATSVSCSSHALSRLNTLKIAPAPTREHSIDAHRKEESACASQRAQHCASQTAQHCCSVSRTPESAQRWRVLESFKLIIAVQLQERMAFVIP